MFRQPGVVSSDAQPDRRVCQLVGFERSEIRIPQEVSFALLQMPRDVRVYDVGAVDVDGEIEQVLRARVGLDEVYGRAEMLMPRRGRHLLPERLHLRR